MLSIRLRRQGSKKRPFFRLVVTESHAARDGRSIEVLGHYNPVTEPETFLVNRERLGCWVDKGAKPSATVRTLLARHPHETAPVDEAGSGAAVAERAGS